MYLLNRNMKSKNKILQIIPKNSVGAEIGVHLGNFSENIIKNVRPKLIYLIDPWLVSNNPVHANSWYSGDTITQKVMDERYQSVRRKFSSYKDNVKIIRKFSRDAAEEIPDNSLDFVYIDGDHSFDGVMTDFDFFYPKVKVGGFICGDDYDDTHWWERGVIDALHLNLCKKKLKLVLLEKNQYCCKK